MTTDHKLDVVLAALLGAGLEPKEIVLTYEDRGRLRRLHQEEPGAADGMFRGIPLRVAFVPWSYVSVDRPYFPGDRAPIRPRRFFEWLDLPESWRPERTKRLHAVT